MSLKNINVPLYDSGGEDKVYTLAVNEFAGRLSLKINLTPTSHIVLECYWDDLQRAWDAVKRY